MDTHTYPGTPQHNSRQPTSRSVRRRSAIPETLVVIVLGCLLVIGLARASEKPYPAQPTARVYVGQGDTYWSIAAEHPIAGQTTQQTAQEIARLNSAEQGTLRAGTTIRIPIAPNDTTVVARR